MPLLEKIKEKESIKYIDLFCGIGGFRVAANQTFGKYKIKHQCVFSCDIDKDAQKNYQNNFGEIPKSDIQKIPASHIPDHEILFAGFPCQPFSICGELKGFEDARGTLFFEIARILEKKKPDCFVLENVKQLVGHNKGETLKIMISILENLGYSVFYKVLNALDFGLPQKRERIFIVGFIEKALFRWKTNTLPMKSLEDILEVNVSSSYYASQQIRQNRLDKYKGKQHDEITIWHENKSGNISAYPYSCALRAGASYNYLLVNGERRLTEREMLRLQGFPDSFNIVGSYSTARKLIGNSVAVPCVSSILHSILEAAGFLPTQKINYQTLTSLQPRFVQLSLFE